MPEPCYVLPKWRGTCDRGTEGCDACERCTCHACYSHEECQCDAPCDCPPEVQCGH